MIIGLWVEFLPLRTLDMSFLDINETVIDIGCQWSRKFVFAWGDNFYGQYGTGSAGKSFSRYGAPVYWNASVYTGADYFTKVSASFLHVVAFIKGGKIYTWGYNFYGQLGRGDIIDSHTPIAVNMSYFNSTIAQVVAGAIHSLALSSAGFFYAWGDNQYG